MPAGGMEQLQKALLDLAAHPSTAEHIAFKLVRHFITDQPTPEMVDPIKQKYSETNGNLKAVSLALLDLPEAWSRRSPSYAHHTSTSSRNIAHSAVRYADELDRPAGGPLAALSNRLWEPDSPEGYSDETYTWLNPDAMRVRIDIARYAQQSDPCPESTLNVPALASSLFSSALSPATRNAPQQHSRQQQRADRSVLLPGIPAKVTAMTDDRSGPAEDARLAQAACEGLRGIPSAAFAPRRARRHRRPVLLGLHAPLCAWRGQHDPRLLIVVLRGGMDGLNVCVPFGDTNYAPMRGSIAIPAASTIKLNSFFGLHPALTNFGDLYKAGDAAVVHAASIPLRSRSHFDAQDNLENGMPATLSRLLRPDGSIAC